MVYIFWLGIIYENEKSNYSNCYHEQYSESGYRKSFPDGKCSERREDSASCCHRGPCLSENEFGPNGSKKARGTNRERNVSGKLISEILRAYYLLFVLKKYRYYMISMIWNNINSNMTFQNKKARSARTRCSACKFRALMRRQSH